MPSFISKKIQLRKSATHGMGAFAIKKIKKDEKIFDFTDGGGKTVSIKEAKRIYQKGKIFWMQAGDDAIFIGKKDEEPYAYYMNHSCDPNCGFFEELGIVAMRDIEPYEELAIDYAMCNSSDLHLQCSCGSDLCRKVITHSDWKMLELQNRYKNYFSSYLQKNIDAKKYE